jgi:Caspase domain
VNICQPDDIAGAWNFTDGPMLKLFLRTVALVYMLVFATTAMAASRTALVVGNSAYPFGPLLNPANDAKLIAETLQKTGFDVTIVLDANRMAMQQALLDFSRDIRTKDTVGLFYYAGHGAQVNGANYLIPVDADIKSESEVKIFAINVDEFVATLERADGRTNIVILDSCRNNPFGSGTRSINRGMALPDAPAGTFVALSTSPGAVALDGEGVNSPYAEALSKSMLEPNVSIEQAFKVTRRLVLQNTKQKQVPWETSSLTGDFYFLPKTETAVPLVEAAPESVVVPEPKVEEPAQVAVAEPPPEPATPTMTRNMEEVYTTPRDISLGQYPAGLVMADDGLWIALIGKRKIIKIDVDSGKKLDEVAVGRLPNQMTVDTDGNIYTAIVTDNKIHRRSSDGSSKVFATIKSGGILNGLGFGTGALYTSAWINNVPSQTILSRIDLRSSKVKSSPTPISGAPRAFTMTKNAPWVVLDNRTVASFDAQTLALISSTDSDGVMWSMAANTDAVFVGGREQESSGKAIIQRHAQNNPEDKISQVLDSEQAIGAIAATADRVVALTFNGEGWVLDATTLKPLKHFNAGAPPRYAIIDRGKLYVTTTFGSETESGSVLVFEGLLD